MTKQDAAALAEMRKRAESWLRDATGNLAVTRDTAIGDENMALDVLELLDLVENNTCARHADQKHGAEAELFFVRYHLLGRAHLAGPDHWNALHSQYVEILNLDGATNVEIVEAAEVMPSAYLEARDEKLAAVTKERDSHDAMLRSILALCDDSTRASLGPDAPLRAVRKLKANHDAYADSGFEGQLAAERKEVARLEDENHRLTTELAKARASASTFETERDAYRSALCDMLSTTNDVENPSSALTFYRGEARDLLKHGPALRGAAADCEGGK